VSSAAAEGEATLVGKVTPVAATVVRPLTITPEPGEVVADGDVNTEDAGLGVDTATGLAVVTDPDVSVVVEPSTELELPLLSTPVVVVEELAEVTADEESVEVEELLLTVDEESVEVEESLLIVDEGSVEVEELLDVVFDEEPLVGSSSSSVHSFTSWTAGLPSSSVIGVRVTVQVSIIGPAVVFVVCTVCTVVESEARRKIGAAFIELRRVEMKQKKSKKAEANRIILSTASCY